MRSVALVALCLVGCVRTGTDTCSDGTLCPDGTACYPVAVTSTIECVTPEQLASCDGRPDGEDCGDGTCYSGACLPVGCNNRRLDRDEVCDDGNNLPGDGCAADCSSNETCGNGITDPVRLVDGLYVLDEQCDDSNVVGRDGCSSLCAPERSRVVPVGNVPRRRVQAAMATDPVRRRIVMFGGLIGDPNTTLGEQRLSNETWELDEDGWRELDIPDRPPPRVGHAMAFDGARMVMFGGGDIVRAFEDTWVLIGNHWTRLSPASSPSARTGHAMAMLPGVGVVLFGGTDNGLTELDDTWIFANGEWSRFAGASPPARHDHTLTLDPLRGVLVLTGGDGASGRVVDTWELDATGWRQIATASSPPVAAASAAFDRVRGRVVIDGGFTPVNPQFPIGVSVKTWSWDGAAWADEGSLGNAVAQAAAAADPITGEMVVFGGGHPPPLQCGACTTVYDTTRRYEQGSWQLRPFAELPPTAGAAAALDPLRRRVVAYIPPGRTFELAGGSWLESPATSPPAREYAAMAFGRVGTAPAAIMFGGVVGATPTPRANAMWSWNGAAWSSLAPSTMPAPRYRHAMAFDARRGRTVLFGGADASSVLGDSWAWDGTAWTQITGPQPPPRRDAAMAYDPVRDEVLLFGGNAPNSTTLGDLWRLDASGWSRIETAFAPSPRGGAAMAWDAARQRIVLFGGAASLETWEWDGTTWAFVDGDTTTTRYDFPLVSAPDGGGVIAIGGVTDVAQQSKDTLRVAFTSGSADYAACRSDLDDDEDGAVGCADPDCWPVCAPLCPPGAPCDPAAPRCGDGVCDAPRERCGSCGDCACP